MHGGVSLRRVTFAGDLYFAMIDRLVLGTGNRKKLLEMEGLLQGTGLRLLTLSDFTGITEVVEDGHSFAENAEKKARGYALATGCWTVCDDSGISVDALNGAPGIYSARFAGPGANDDANNRLLLEKLKGVPDDERTAYYTCHIALADPSGTIRIRSEGICRGRLRHELDGQGGFGYDPLFELMEYHVTFGRLGSAAKSVISHRARALRDFCRQLQQLQQTRLEKEVSR
jgi:XTP/dITP diphosphohydrolase